MKKKRYYLLDSLRGITLISMILYHAIWDLVYIFGVNMPWYQTQAAYVWQQSICWTFILLSGFCWSLGGQKLKRGLKVFCASILISAVTLIAMPENRVLFGVLSLIGTAMILMIPLEHIFKRVQPYVGIVISFGLFVLTRNVNRGYLGVGGFKWLTLPKAWYANWLTAYIGFPSADFWSTDYFSVVPWIFLYWTGYFLYRIANLLGCMHWLTGIRIRFLEAIGRHSLEIYLLHQPIIYGVLYVIFVIVLR
jgi:uncharacterized membrane protein